LLSYSQSSARFAAGDHALSSHSGVAGLYGTWHAGIVDVGFSLLSGLQAHESFRRIATAGGIETARGAFAGVFAAPGVSASLPLVTTGATSVAARASATAVTGWTAGYSETGATSNLTIGARALNSLDARLGLDVRQAFGIGRVSGEA